MSSLKDTPVNVLEREIGYYEVFKRRLETMEGIYVEANSEAADKKLNDLIIKVDEKIQVFKTAIKMLNSEPTPEVSDTRDAK